MHACMRMWFQSWGRSATHQVPNSVPPPPCVREIRSTIYGRVTLTVTDPVTPSSPRPVGYNYSRLTNPLSPSSLPRSHSASSQQLLSQAKEERKVAMATATVRVVAAAAAMLMAVAATADMSADRAACADQLVGLAPCLQYVQGQARAPAPDCCGGLRQVLGKSPKCLCVLIKDKDDPNLGIKINASLALALPAACGATQANVSHCPQLLHIPPNSKDAAIFSPGGDKGTTAAPGKDNTTSTTTSGAQQATNGGSVSTSTATAGVALLAAGYLALLLPADLFPVASF